MSVVFSVAQVGLAVIGGIDYLPYGKRTIFACSAVKGTAIQSLNVRTARRRHGSRCPAYLTLTSTTTAPKAIKPTANSIHNPRFCPGPCTPTSSDCENTVVSTVVTMIAKSMMYIGFISSPLLS